MASQGIASDKPETPLPPLTSANAQKWNLHLPNPFVPSATNNENKVEHIEGLSTRAWTTTVGWHPGESAFPTAMTHESKLVLISFGHKVER